MYHTCKATERHDKVYALLGMSSDDPIAAGLSADYKTPWRRLFQQLIHFVLSELVPVNIDHFDLRCQQLCSHIQQWVLRFSKFSDMRTCHLTSEIKDEKAVDRLDNAVLDGRLWCRYVSSWLQTATRHLHVCDDGYDLGVYIYSVLIWYRPRAEAEAEGTRKASSWSWPSPGNTSVACYNIDVTIKARQLQESARCEH
ncbi:involucrin repeat protein [Ilyonectria robusta]